MKPDFLKDFNKVNKNKWIEKATEDLKGENPLKKFEWSLEPGLSVKPYYSKEDLEENGTTAFQNRLFKKDHPSGKIRHWNNLQLIKITSDKEANSIALNALENGADGLIFEFPEKTETHNLSALLKNIEAQYCSLWFKNLPTGQLGELSNLLKQNFSLICRDQEELEKAVASDAKQVILNHPLKKDLTFTEQLSDLMALTARSAGSDTISVDRFFKKNALQYTLGTDFFGDISAIRVLRQLYFQVARAFDVNDFKPEDLHIIGLSTVWNNEQYNPHANMLKGTTAGMAAILGGCDSIMIEPESTETEYMTRIARNVSNILKEESYFDSNADPVAGSYYVESLTSDLAKETWNKFQKKVTDK